MKLLLGLVAATLSAATIWTSQGDNTRNNYNPSETVLTVETVPGTRLVASLPVDGAVWGQPLIVGGKVLVCTMHNSCYAFDETTHRQIWYTGTLASSRTSYPDNGGHINYGQEIGCLSTPVVDVGASSLYVVCGNSTPAWVLYKISTIDGTLQGSVVISGQVPGIGDTGDCISGSNLLFCPGFALQRSGLALSNGTVYVAFSSYGDYRPFHGWVMAYKDLVQTGIFCTTPNSYGGSIWQGAGAPAIDASGNIYVTTGNGGYDGVTEFAMSAIKLSPTLGRIDSFTPVNWSVLSAGDFDLASGRVMLLPGVGRIFFGAKDFNVYSLNTQCLSCSPQVFITNPLGGTLDDGIFGGVFGGGTGYFPTVAGSIYKFKSEGPQWNTSTFVGPVSYNFPGAQMTLAGNVLWALTADTSAESAPASGTLRAIDPTSLVELWSTKIGTLSKFAPPTIANGYIYVPTLDGVVKVYGILSTKLHKGSLKGKLH